MKKFVWWLLIVIVLWVGVWLVIIRTNSLSSLSVLSWDVQNLSDMEVINTTKVKIADKPTACALNYAPVCAKVNIQCITTPCDPIEQTFGNRCQMEANKLAEFLHEGECIAK